MVMTPIDLDIDMLRCFVEVAGARSFTKAGKNIGLTQSGVSIKIRRLEDRLNSQVFNRSSKSLSLTREGEILLDYAGRILSVHDEAVGQLTQPAATGNLRIGLLDYFLPELLPSILARFRKHFPSIHLEIHTEVGIDLLPRFRNGELDLVVAGRDNFSDTSRILYEEPLVWAVGQGADVTAHERLQLALLPSPCHFRGLASELLEKAGRTWDISYTGTSMSSVQAAVQAGIGISILPKGAVRKGLRKAPAHLGLPKLPMYSLALFIDENRPDEARDLFVSYLEAELEDL